MSQTDRSQTSPASPAGAAQIPVADRSQAPAVEQPRAWAYPQSAQLDLAGAGGVRVFDLPGQKVVSVEVAVPMPWAAEPREIEGVGVIVAATLEEGTGSKDADQVARAFERLGVDFSVISSEFGLLVGLEATPERLAEGLRLLAEVLAEPAFPEAAVAREVRGRLFDIAQEMNSPASRAAREFATLLHGADAREGRPGAGSAETVQAVTVDAVRAHHRAWVRPARAQVVVAGDLAGQGAQEVAAMVQRELVDPWSEQVAQWPEKAAEAAADAEVPGREPGAAGAAPVGDDAVGGDGAPIEQAGEGAQPPLEVLTVDRPGAAQTEVRLGWLGPTRHTEGGYAPYAPLAVHVGASPASLLDAVLREEKGWTYGMRAGFRPRSRVGEFTVSGSFTTESTAEAVQEMVRLLRSVDDGIEEKAATEARDYALLTAPMRYATAQVVAHEAAVLALDGLTPEYTTRTLAELAELDADSMAEAWRRWSGGRWVLVLVGDASVWGEELADLSDHRTHVEA
ncbi:M16 family metallopeptidase [Kytococcus sedentarius]|uniref:M16 family metallopeptidase n=1 Tax=Kytococcus sedentarius TaxID=1276 RepID=UPI00194F1741|nr:insulinase family protein [Kytococcus sedentarius]QRO86746.1 insulinase family protein [Kytococcus sedentarius]